MHESALSPAHQTQLTSYSWIPYSYFIPYPLKQGFSLWLQQLTSWSKQRDNAQTIAPSVSPIATSQTNFVVYNPKISTLETKKVNQFEPIRT